MISLIVRSRIHRVSVHSGKCSKFARIPALYALLASFILSRSVRICSCVKIALGEGKRRMDARKTRGLTTWFACPRAGFAGVVCCAVLCTGVPATRRRPGAGSARGCAVLGGNPSVGSRGRDCRAAGNNWAILSARPRPGRETDSNPGGGRTLLPMRACRRSKPMRIGGA